MSTPSMPHTTPPARARLRFFAALCALLIVGSTFALWLNQRDHAKTATSPVESPAFEAALVEELAEPAEVAQESPPEEVVEQAPERDLHAEEALSEEAVELGYRIEELTQQQQGAAPKKAGKKRNAPKRVTLKPANLVAIANFDITDISVNGLPYPEYYEEEEDRGMVLPAGGPYDVKVTYAGKTKAYEIGLRPYETRYLMAEIPAYAGTSVAPVAPPPATPNAPPVEAPENPSEQKQEDESAGRVTVYSKPRGDILIDGKDLGKRTPNTVESEDGRHEVQVRYEGGEVSEKKVVRVRKGSRIKLFFRQRTDGQ